MIPRARVITIDNICKQMKMSTEGKSREPNDNEPNANPKVVKCEI